MNVKSKLIHGRAAAALGRSATKPSVAWTLAIVSVGLFMTTLDNLVVTTALPSIRRSLGASIQSLEWTVNAYTLTFAVRDADDRGADRGDAQ